MVGWMRWRALSQSECGNSKPGWWLVGWLEFNIPFQHKHGYIRDKRSGMESYLRTQWRKASYIL